MKVKQFLSMRDLKKVIHAFLFTRLDYCNSLYVGIINHRFQLVQNAAASLLTGTHKRDHITPVLSFLQWLPIHYRINFKILFFVYKSLHSMALLYLVELIEKHEPKWFLRSAE